MVGGTGRGHHARANGQIAGHVEPAAAAELETLVGDQFQALHAGHLRAGQRAIAGPATVGQDQLVGQQAQRAVRRDRRITAAGAGVAQREAARLQLRQFAGAQKATQAAGFQRQACQLGAAQVHRAVDIERAVTAQGERAGTGQAGQAGCIQQQPRRADGRGAQTQATGGDRQLATGRQPQVTAERGVTRGVQFYRAVRRQQRAGFDDQVATITVHVDTYSARRRLSGQAQQGTVAIAVGADFERTCRRCAGPGLQLAAAAHGHLLPGGDDHIRRTQHRPAGIDHHVLRHHGQRIDGAALSARAAQQQAGHTQRREVPGIQRHVIGARCQRAAAEHGQARRGDVQRAPATTGRGGREQIAGQDQVLTGGDGHATGVGHLPAPTLGKELTGTRRRIFGAAGQHGPRLHVIDTAARSRQRAAGERAGLAPGHQIVAQWHAELERVRHIRHGVSRRDQERPRQQRVTGRQLAVETGLKTRYAAQPHQLARRELALAGDLVIERRRAGTKTRQHGKAASHVGRRQDVARATRPGQELVRQQVAAATHVEPGAGGDVDGAAVKADGLVR